MPRPPRPVASDYRRALLDNQFELLYQPVIDLSANTVGKAEALLRWYHPGLGHLRPDSFIAHAERTGWMVELGEWVISQALADLGQLHRVEATFELSLNVSPAQVRSDAFGPELFLGALAKSGVPAGSVIVEITEGMALEPSLSTREKMTRLRDAGLKLALDDFGMGHSALASLVNFTCDYIKLDRALVMDALTNRRAKAVAGLIVAMAHELDMQVIAEGVETPAQLDLVASLGCDHAQGFLWMEPVPLKRLLALLQEGKRGTTLTRAASPLQGP